MSQDAIISKVSIIVTFSHIKAEVAKFDLAVKYVNINTGLSFEQNITSSISGASYQVSSKSTYWFLETRFF